jgi:hypothetical protein
VDLTARAWDERAMLRTTRSPAKAKAKPTTGWGGARAGAGRKPKGDVAGVPHGRRAPVSAAHPLHVQLALAPEVAALRRPIVDEILRATLAVAAARGDVRVVRVGRTAHHLHLLVEARSSRTLTRGIQGLSISVARRLGAALPKKRGVAIKVLRDRYLATALTTPAQLKAAIAAVAWAAPAALPVEPATLPALRRALGA